MKPRFLDGNRLQLLRNGTDYFPALEQAIDSSQREIFLETYIFTGDKTGLAIAAALARAARRGVSVHALVDGFGSKDTFHEVKQQLLEAGVRVMIYHPKISPLTLRRNRLRRLHRKLVAIDGRVAFAGGINVIDDMNTPGRLPPRYDYAVRIEGPLAVIILGQAWRLWNRIAWGNFHWNWLVKYRATLPADVVNGNKRVALVVRDNFRHRSDIEDAYLEAIDQAGEEVIIASAYFFPGQRFRQALVGAAGRGVRVRLMLQGRQEYLLLHYATRALYGALLNAGVEIYEYHKSFMHAKVAVIDQRWATVGSSNIDPFSLLLAREANVIVDDQDFAQKLRASLYHHMEDGATMVAKTQWYRQPLWRRVIFWSAYGLARLLMGLVDNDRKQ